jgi:hypothetical protein
MLRKKTVSLEERLSNKTELERQKDEESVKCRKLMKLAENYKRELNELHAELRDMRARLLTTSELQVRFSFDWFQLPIARQVAYCTSVQSGAVDLSV